MSGPLTGIRVVELAGLGPAPFAGMLLADMGADVLRLDRPAPAASLPSTLGRGRRSVTVDLKRPEGVEVALELIDRADALIEGFRPGVTERLGLGPEPCLARNPRLVYGRMTGWGQEGPLSGAAGHDINYIALAGALHTIGTTDSGPVPPLNLLGDFGGGGMLLAFGVVCGILEAQRSGEGQVVDAAMVDGAALLMTMIHEFRAIGAWEDRRAANLLDGGAPFYDTYETADGEYVAIGSLEPQFYAELVSLAGAEPVDERARFDKAQWPAQKERMKELFRSKTRDEWCELLEGSDVCFAPVLSIQEAIQHPHNKARGTFIEIAGNVQPGPAPRFSRTAAAIPTPAPAAGQHTDAALADWGFAPAEVAALREKRVIG
jgi:alpha-methylacyl-CoA racemase